jgi:hypothetical protein
VNQPKDTVRKVPVTVNKPITDSAFKTPEPVKTNSVYTFRADDPHFAVVVLNKVDKCVHQ